MLDTALPWIFATVGFGYVPERSPPAVPAAVAVPGAHWLAKAFHTSAWPLVVGAVLDTALPWIFATVGFGYVPLKSPPAAPVAVTVLGAHCVPVHTSDWFVVGAVLATALPCTRATVGSGYVPLRSPPALPDAATELGAHCVPLQTSASPVFGAVLDTARD